MTKGLIANGRRPASMEFPLTFSPLSQRRFVFSHDAADGERKMADKNQTMWAGIGVVVAVIMFANMGGGGTFAVTSKSTGAETPAPGAARAELARASSAQMREAAARSGLPGPDDDHMLTRRAGEPSIITYKTGNPKIDKSISDARAHLSYFWDHHLHPQPGDRTFTLKVAFPVTKGGQQGREHIWVTYPVRKGAALTGRLDNDPDMMPGKSGDTVSFTEDMVTDWGFVQNGKMVGFYSTRVMLEDAPPAEAAQIRSMLGENPA
jgi:uncharacterized protein YegJ (DUF2314 family)